MVPTPNEDDGSVICRPSGLLPPSGAVHGPTYATNVTMYPAGVSHDITLQRGSATRVTSLSESRPPSLETGLEAANAPLRRSLQQQTLACGAWLR
jgi:hypothetical protein